MMPEYIDVFIAPIRDNLTAQVVTEAAGLLLLLNIVLGVTSAVIRHDWSSKVMRSGVSNLVSVFTFAIVSLIVDAIVSVGIDIGFDAPVFVACCTYVCIMEIGSLMENIVDLNPKLKESPLFIVLRKVEPKPLEEAAHE